MNESNNNRFSHTHLNFDLNQTNEDSTIHFEFCQTRVPDNTKSANLKHNPQDPNSMESIVEVSWSEICCTNEKPLYNKKEGKAENEIYQDGLLNSIELENQKTLGLYDNVSFPRDLVTQIITASNNSKAWKDSDQRSLNKLDPEVMNFVQVIVGLDDADQKSEQIEMKLNNMISENENSEFLEHQTNISISSQPNSSDLYAKTSSIELENQDVTEMFSSNNEDGNYQGVGTDLLIEKSHETNTFQLITNMEKVNYFESQVISCCSTKSFEDKIMKELMDPVKTRELEFNCQLLDIDLLQATNEAQNLDKRFATDNFEPVKWETRFDMVLKQMFFQNEF